MNSLHALRVGAPAGEKERKGIHVVEIRDERTRQTLVIESREPVAAYNLEGAGWETGGKHSDGVIVGEVDGEVWVCFVDLTGKLKAEVAGAPLEERKFSQLLNSAEHFHPGEPLGGLESHGAEHHTRWSDGSDPLEVRPLKDHRVVGIAVANRRVPRPPPTGAVAVGRTTVPLRVVQISQAERNVARTTLRGLLQGVGQIVGRKGGS